MYLSKFKYDPVLGPGKLYQEVFLIKVTHTSIIYLYGWRVGQTDSMKVISAWFF